MAAEGARRTTAVYLQPCGCVPFTALEGQQSLKPTHLPLHFSPAFIPAAPQPQLFDNGHHDKSIRTLRRHPPSTALEFSDMNPADSSVEVDFSEPPARQFIIPGLLSLSPLVVLLLYWRKLRE